MQTPIYDFLCQYREKDAIRLHMPGHKGNPRIGIEPLDITEIVGADSLYEANGIIRKSEENASSLFSCDTFYSTEGSSHCIRAMLYLTLIYAKASGRDPLILAARNVHKSFVSAVAQTGIDVEFVSSPSDSYLSSEIGVKEVSDFLDYTDKKPVALYVTSPDYLGKIAPIEKLSRLCKTKGMLLLVDNAHGAYLHFLEKSRHPIAYGADLVCDSAHKTLPALTGAAYLHINKSVSGFFSSLAKEALVLFGSTSPSYLTLASLDLLNKELSTDFKEKLALVLQRIDILKQKMILHGYTLISDEPLKITVSAKKFGLYAYELAEKLMERDVFPEFYDRDYLVLMLSPDIDEQKLERLCEVFLSVPRGEEINEPVPPVASPKRKMSVREAILSVSEEVSVSDSMGRVVASLSVSCPPAIPIAVSGEVVDGDVISALRYYGIDRVRVVK